MPLDIGYQTIGQQALKGDEEFQKRKQQAMQSLQQSAESERASRIREAAKTGFQSGAGAIAGSTGPSNVAAQRTLSREMAIAQQEYQPQVAQAAGQEALARRQQALEQKAAGEKLALGEREVGFAEKIVGREEATSQEKIGLMQDEVSRISEEMKAKGQYLDRNNQLQIAILDNAAAQFDAQMQDAQYQYEQGRISKEQLTAIQEQSTQRLQDIQNAYQETINDIQRKAALQAAQTRADAAREAKLAEARYGSAGKKQTGIMGGITGGLEGLASFFGPGGLIGGKG